MSYVTPALTILVAALAWGCTPAPIPLGEANCQLSAAPDVNTAQ